jgi:cytochrome c biogenesis factor
MDSPSMLEPTTKVMRQSFLHRNFIFLKAHYFLFFSAFGMLYPILNITLRGRGLSTSELSYINIIIPFIVFVTNPIIGFIADKLRGHKLIYSILLGIVTISYASIFILPWIQSRNIQADMIYDSKLGPVLDFCASQEVATKCASRSECGCSYQANCTSMNQMRTPFSFKFSMSSKNIYKDLGQPKACGIEYQVPIDESITQNRSLSK